MKKIALCEALVRLLIGHVCTVYDTWFVPICKANAERTTLIEVSVATMQVREENTRECRKRDHKPYGCVVFLEQRSPLPEVVTTR